MGQPFHKGKQPVKGLPCDRHIPVLAGKDDAMLIIINIRRILKKPRLPAEVQPDHPMAGAAGMAHLARIPFVFHTQQALGVVGAFLLLGRRDILGIFLRLGQVDGDIQVAVLGRGLVADILRNAAGLDVVAYSGKAVKLLGGQSGRLPVTLVKPGVYLRRLGKEYIHHRAGQHFLHIEQILDHTGFRRILGQNLQQLRNVQIRRFPLLVFGQPQQI